MSQPARPPTDLAPLPCRGQRGLTLIELLMVLALLGLLTGLALPAFSALRERSRLAAIQNELLASLALARSEAIRSRRPVLVCPGDGEATGCRDDGLWHAGWMSFVDEDGNHRYDPGGDRLLEVHGPVQGLQLVSTAGRPRVRYTADGLSTGSNLSLRVCRRGEAVSAVVLNNSGRARVERDPRDLARLDCPR